MRNWLVSLWGAARHWPKKSTKAKSHKENTKEKRKPRREFASTFKHLLKAPSRKAVEEMFAAAYKARHVHPPPPKLVEATAAALQIEAPEALKVVESMSALAARAVFEDATSVEAVAELFPAGFHANLGKLLCQVVAQNAPAWRREAASGANTISLPKLAEIDWRIDVKSASERGRMSVPTVLVQLQVEKSPSRVDEETQHENVTFELDRATLETMLEGLGRIRDQLNTISTQ